MNETKLIYEAINTIMNEIEPICKSKTNGGQGYKYRGIDDVYNVLNPLMCKHGVFAVPYVVEQKREERATSRGGNLIYTMLTVDYDFCAKDGSFITVRVVGEGMDSGDKSANKAMSAAMKYACFQLFCIPTADLADADSESPDPSKPIIIDTDNGEIIDF